MKENQAKYNNRLKKATSDKDKKGRLEKAQTVQRWPTSYPKQCIFQDFASSDYQVSSRACRDLKNIHKTFAHKTSLNVLD